MLAFSLYVSTFAALDLAQTSALHTHPHRVLEGTHHTIQYAPDVVKKPHDTPEQNEDGEACDSCDLHEMEVLGSLDLELMALDELKFSSSQDVDLDINGAANVDIFLVDGETLDYEGKGDQILDLSSSGSLDFLADASLDADAELDTDLDFNDGTVDVDLADNEEYAQDLEFKQNEYIDETIDIPEGAKSIRLRVHNDTVNLDIIKGATQLTKSEAQSEQKVVKAPKKEVKKEEKEEEKTPATAAEEVSVSFAAKAKEWIGGDVQKNAILGGLIGAAVAIVGIAVVALFKSRKRDSESAEDAPDDVDAEIELDESESESDSDSDEDVEASVTAVTKEEAEQKKTSVVEGSV